MAIDIYAPCPCGSGKKIKFCCGDLATDIDRVLRMLEGDQRVAALRMMGLLLEKHPNRVALLDLEANIALTMQDWDRAGAASDRILEQQPENINGLVQRAIVLAIRGEAVEAATTLQKALGNSDRRIPENALEAFYIVGCSLIDARHIIAAQAHLRQHWILQAFVLAQLRGQDTENRLDSRALKELTRLYREGGLPLLLKDELALMECPKDVPWEKDFNEAVRHATSGAWGATAIQLKGLLTISEDDPSVVYNIAMLHGYLADTKGLVDGLRHYASLDVPTEEAVEALARANLLDQGHDGDEIDRVRRTYELSDPDKVIELLEVEQCSINLQDKNTSSIADDSDGPPPAARFLLIDRPTPIECDKITREEMPSMRALLLIYGRETDQCGRLVFAATKNQHFDEAIQQIESAVGDELGAMREEEVVGKIDRVYDAISLQWHMPENISSKHFFQLRREQRHHALVEIWPTIQQHTLGGQSPNEAAKDPARRIDLMAALLILETTSLAAGAGAAISELRDRLGLDEPTPIDPTTTDLSRISFARMMRFETEKLDDDNLCSHYQRTKLADVENVQAHLARELVRRPHLKEIIDFHGVFDVLIRNAENSDSAMAIVDQARELLAGDEGIDTMLDVAECSIYLDEGNTDGVRRVMDHIRQEHENDERVHEMLYQVFASRGLLQQPEEQGDAGPGSIEGEKAESEPASQIWTPESERAAAASEDKPTIWTP